MSNRNLIIVGNWKMNKTPQETKEFFNEFKILYENENSKILDSTKFGIASPSIDIETMSNEKINNNMIVAAQDVHTKESGAYTGDLSAKMIKSIGANAVVIGHSERRQYHCELDEIINEKTKVAIKNNLLPIVCIGETLEERKSEIWKDVLAKQIKGAIEGIDKKDLEKIVIAYEPIWAIGTGVTATSDQAQEACKYVRWIVEENVNIDVANKIHIQYGGSVKPENVAEILGKDDIDGALVGGASLDPKSFIKLLTLNK